MVNAGLFDGTFPGQKSATLGGDNIGEGSQHINWIRDQVLPITFYTDMCLEESLKHPSNIVKVAWLIEPYSISYTHYEKAIAMQDAFDYILTFDRQYLSQGEKWKWYALGGSWIRRIDWDYYDVVESKKNPKAKAFSLIGTNKRRTRGHNLRVSAAELSRLFPIDVMGHGYRDISSKIEALRPYRYSIVIENERIEGYFTEKLIDCMSQMTVPIYWGAPNITDFFDEMGIIRFETLDQLTNILVNIQNNDTYRSRITALTNNYNRLWEYTCAEDWIYRYHREIFTEKK